jgi:hypothetical protein
LPFYKSKAKIYFAKILTESVMSNKTRSILRAIAVVIVLLAVLMDLQIIIIPAIAVYKFWMVVAAFGIMLISSK